MTPQKVKIAVRMPDKSRRLYTVDAVPGMDVPAMRAATLAEIPNAAAILITVPDPVRLLEPEAA